MLSLTETRTPPFNDPSTSVYTYDYDVNEAWEHYLRNEIGYKPTGNAIDVEVFDLFQLKDGVLVEHWAMVDSLGILKALGARVVS